MSAIDLFCGAGGASLGLHRAGYDVHGYDHWQPAVDTHNANGLPATLLDLSTDDPPGSCDLLWASPPCQPFSAAGKGDGEFDGRDGFPWLLRILERMEPRPAVVLVENVKGLTFATHGDYFAAVLAGIRALGYDVDWRVLNCADYGVPQTRERCIIVARRDGGPITWPAPTHTEQPGLFTERWVTMAEALGWGGELSYRRGDGMSERHGERGPWDTAAIPAPTVHRNSEKDWLLQPGGSGYADGPNRRPYGLDEPAPAIAFGNDVCSWVWKRPATTIAGDVRVMAPGWHDPNESGSQMKDAIRLTIAELATLQGFPPDWIWTGTKTAQARQVGNAVPPALAKAVARANTPVAVAS